MLEILVALFSLSERKNNGKLNKNKIIQEDAEMYLPFLMEGNEVRTNEG